MRTGTHRTRKLATVCNSRIATGMCVGTTGFNKIVTPLPPSQTTLLRPKSRTIDFITVWLFFSFKLLADSYAYCFPTPLSFLISYLLTYLLTDKYLSYKENIRSCLHQSWTWFGKDWYKSEDTVRYCILLYGNSTTSTCKHMAYEPKERKINPDQLVCKDIEYGAREDLEYGAREDLENVL